MDATDRVLVGVIKTKRDVKFLLEQQWYRIPQGKAEKGIDADFLAFFISKSAAKPDDSGIYYYAERLGMELVRRVDLILNQPTHARANDIYHKIQLGEIQRKEPPIVNKPNGHSFSFIYTTGDRFLQAVHIRDLYSKADYLVDRVYHVLRQKGLAPLRTWENQSPPPQKQAEIIYPTYAQIRLIAERGEVIATTDPTQKPTSSRQELIYLAPDGYLDDIEKQAKTKAQAIQALMQQMGGPKTLSLPYDDY